MPDPFAAALPIIREILGEGVRYIPAEGSDAIDPLVVIWSDEPGAPFEGPGNTTRTVSAEIGFADVPGRPTKATRIVRKGVTWKVIQIVDRDDVEAWTVTMEKAA